MKHHTKISKSHLANEAVDAIIPVIMCGGGGERLWPLSRSAHPKHLLSFAGQESLLSQTANRLKGLCEGSEAIVLCNHTDRFQVGEQVHEQLGENVKILLEPVRRDTAAAVSLAVAALNDYRADSLVLICAADHVIEDSAAFEKTVRSGISAARKGKIVTFGIAPTSAHTGYGYLKLGAALKDTSAYKLSKFVEKPNLSNAEKMVKQGGFLWNAGIFLFEVGVMREALRMHFPEGWSAVNRAFEQSEEDFDFIRIDKEAFSEAPKTSIDYAVMEKVKNLCVVSAQFDWNDVGSWSSVSDIIEKDEDGNARFGPTVMTDSKDSLVYSSNGMVVATLGVEDMVIATTHDAVMVCPKDRAQDLKKLVQDVRDSGLMEEYHKAVFRPWGSYESLVISNRYQVKKIIVKPGKTLSLQRHHHRSEHWIVVQGAAQVTVGEEQTLMTENQSIYVPIGSVHRLENPGRIDLELIEVQTGSYLGEDDIIRISDHYNRRPGE